MKTIFPAILLLIVTTGYSQPQKLYFDPNYAGGAPQSQLFEEIQYIPLETTRGSRFGRISELIVTPQYFIVRDNDTDAVYFFDRRGKFLRKYSMKGYRVMSIQLVPKKNTAYISFITKSYNPSQSEIKKWTGDPKEMSGPAVTRAVYYDLKDVTKGKVTPIANFSLAILRPTLLKDGLWAYSHIYADKKWEDSTDYELKIWNGQRTLREYFPFNMQKSSEFFDEPARISFYSNPSDGTILFSRPYHYTLYQLLSDSITERYTFVLPAESSLPASFFTQNFASKTELLDFKTKHTQYNLGIRGVTETAQYLFFGLDYLRGGRDRSYLFDKASNQFYNQFRISSDSNNYFLPVIPNGIQYNDGARLYSSVSSAAMFQSKEAAKTRNLEYNAVLKKYFAGSDRNGNPVIVQLKPKIKQ
jgi:hypothetical protein